MLRALKLGAIAAFVCATSAKANVIVSEVLGSTTSSDNEYIELFNTSTASIDIGNWQVELWDSDAGGSFGLLDGGSPYVVPAGTELPAGSFYLFANELAQSAFGVNGDVLLPSNAIENSSYTLVLRNASGDVVEAIFVTDGDAEDAPNIQGNLITPDLSVGPDGTNLPAGFNRDSDNPSNFILLEFAPQPSASGTPTPSTTTPPDEEEPVTISEIQGAGHTSPFVGQNVVTTGVVTAVDSNGFYVQDPQGDGDIATSDALFVFTGGAPSVVAGNLIEMSGSVSEFFPGGAGTGNLSTTQMAFPQITVIGDAELPAPIVIGLGGRIPPGENIDDDAFASFDPDSDGIDFFESLEAMRVVVPSPLAVSPTSRFQEIFTVADNGASATGLSLRQTLNISPDDFNPEKIQIDFDSGLLPGFDFPFVDVGATFSGITGVIAYDFGNFQVHPTAAFETVDSVLSPAVANINSGSNLLTIASYNVLNLDPSDADDGRFTAIASQIVNNLNAPDIIGLQEIQDNDGAQVSEVAGAEVTLAQLADAISLAGGPSYLFVDTPGLVPAFEDANGDVISPVGGQPGGNIRVAFLYNPNRVSLIGDPIPLTDPQDQAVNPDNPFFRSRISLAADFGFNGETITVVNNHLSSKGGSAPIFGVEQPFEARQEDPTVNGSLDERQRQAQAVSDFVSEQLSSETGEVVVLGDMNEFEFVSPLSSILTSNLSNTTELLADNERYSFNFQGNSQQLDHLLVSEGLTVDAFEVVYVNSEFADVSTRASDHDPLLVALAFDIAGDLNADGLVNVRDLFAFFRAYRSVEGSRRFNPRADFNENGKIDIYDLIVFINLLRNATY